MADSVFDTKRVYENVDTAYGRTGHDFIENGFTPMSGAAPTVTSGRILAFIDKRS